MDTVELSRDVAWLVSDLNAYHRRRDGHSDDESELGFMESDDEDEGEDDAPRLREAAYKRTEKHICLLAGNARDEKRFSDMTTNWC